MPASRARGPAPRRARRAQADAEPGTRPTTSASASRVRRTGPATRRTGPRDRRTGPAEARLADWRKGATLRISYSFVRGGGFCWSGWSGWYSRKRREEYRRGSFIDWRRLRETHLVGARSSSVGTGPTGPRPRSSLPTVAPIPATRHARPVAPGPQRGCWAPRKRAPMPAPVFVLQAQHAEAHRRPTRLSPQPCRAPGCSRGVQSDVAHLGGAMSGRDVDPVG